MAIGHVVTRGFGTGTFRGTIGDVVTRGYLPGEPGGLRKKGRRRKYVLPNGVRITATPEEAEAWLRRLAPELPPDSDLSEPAAPPSVIPAPPTEWEKEAKRPELPTTVERLIETVEEAAERQRLLDEDEALALLLLTQ